MLLQSAHSKVTNVGSALYTAKHIFMINSELIDFVCVYVLTLKCYVSAMCVTYCPFNVNVVHFTPHHSEQMESNSDDYPMHKFCFNNKRFIRNALLNVKS